jgi:hypothetical protein
MRLDLEECIAPSTSDWVREVSTELTCADNFMFVCAMWSLERSALHVVAKLQSRLSLTLRRLKAALSNIQHNISDTAR